MTKTAKEVRSLGKRLELDYARAEYIGEHNAAAIGMLHDCITRKTTIPKELTFYAPRLHLRSYERLGIRSASITVGQYGTNFLIDLMNKDKCVIANFNPTEHDSKEKVEAYCKKSAMFYLKNVEIEINRLKKQPIMQ